MKDNRKGPIKFDWSFFRDKRFNDSRLRDGRSQQSYFDQKTNSTDGTTSKNVLLGHSRAVGLLAAVPLTGKTVLQNQF